MENRSIFFGLMMAVLVTPSGAADPTPGKRYALNLVDVDGRSLSTGNGRFTVLVIATRQDLDKARSVGDRIPGDCLGNPRCQMITVLRFNHTQSRPIRFVTTSLVRRDLNAEAARLKTRYLAKNLTTDPRRDVHVVADFDGETNRGLGLSPNSWQFGVFILSPNGELLRHWREVPTAQELSAALP